MKKLILIVVVVLVLIVVSVPLWIDSAAKAAVESGGSGALGVTTSLEGINFRIFGGECSMEGLEVANPEGFDAPHFLKLGSGAVAVDLGTVMEEKVVIPTVTLTGIDMNLEQTLKGSNYGKILDNLKKGERKGPEEEAGKRFVIEELVIRDVKVLATVSLGVAKAPVPLRVDEIRMRNVGSEGGGVSMAKIFGYVMTGLLNSVLKAGKGILPDDITNGLGRGLGGLGGFTVEGLEVMGAGGKEIVEGVGKGLSGVTKGLGGLLGKDEEKKDK